MVVRKGLFVAKDDKGTPYVIDEFHEMAYVLRRDRSTAQRPSRPFAGNM